MHPTNPLNSSSSADRDDSFAWLTDIDGNTYMGDVDWHISSDPQLAERIAKYFITDSARVRISREEVDRRREALRRAKSTPAGEDTHATRS